MLVLCLVGHSLNSKLTTTLQKYYVYRDIFFNNIVHKIYS